MFGSSQDTLYMVLSVAIALLTIFLSVTLIYLILVLRDASKIIEKAKDTVEKVNNFVVKPVKLASAVFDHLRPLIERAIDRASRKSK